MENFSVNDHLDGRRNNPEEYCLYAKGSFHISFSGKNYNKTGAVARTKNLAKAFFNVKLIAIYADGFREKLWPLAIPKQKK